MFLWSASHRNRFTIAGVLGALVIGCAPQRFLRVEERVVDAHLRFVLGGGGNTLVLTHGREAFVVDVKFGGASKSLRHHVEEALERSVRRALLTHGHVDHAEGLERFRNLGPVLVHPATRRRLEGEGVRAQWIEVVGPIELRLGDEVVRVWHPGRGHTDGDLVAYLAQRKLLVTGDLVTRGLEPVVDETSGGDVLAWADTLDGLLELDFVTALPGHGEPVGRDAFLGLRDYLRAVEAEVRGAHERGLAGDALVEAVLGALEPRPALEAVPFVANREKTVRVMDRALRARAEARSAR